MFVSVRKVSRIRETRKWEKEKEKVLGQKEWNEEKAIKYNEREKEHKFVEHVFVLIVDYTYIF